MKKEVQITQSDLEAIKGSAANKFSKNTISREKASTFLCECYIEAISDFCNKHNLLLETNGKFYKKD